MSAQKGKSKDEDLSHLYGHAFVHETYKLARFLRKRLKRNKHPRMSVINDNINMIKSLRLNKNHTERKILIDGIVREFDDKMSPLYAGFDAKQFDTVIQIQSETLTDMGLFEQYRQATVKDRELVFHYIKSICDAARQLLNPEFEPVQLEADHDFHETATVDIDPFVQQMMQQFSPQEFKIVVDHIKRTADEVLMTQYAQYHPDEDIPPEMAILLEGVDRNADLATMIRHIQEHSDRLTPEMEVSLQQHILDATANMSASDITKIQQEIVNLKESGQLDDN